jgi:hypothetical protein
MVQNVEQKQVVVRLYLDAESKERNNALAALYVKIIAKGSGLEAFLRYLQADGGFHISQDDIEELVEKGDRNPNIVDRLLTMLIVQAPTYSFEDEQGNRLDRKTALTYLMESF